MAQNSKIEWCKHTVNLWWGCTKVHEGCDHCYAETISKRYGEDIWGRDKPRRAIKSAFFDLAKYQKLAKEAGEKHFIFLGSMMDIFEKPMPIVDNKGRKIYLDDMDEVGMDTGDLRSQLFSNISKNEYPDLIFLFLTKRPSNTNKYIPEWWKLSPPENVMFGTSVSTQDNLRTLIPQLMEVKGKKFLSIEPQISYVDLCEHFGIWWNQTENKWIDTEKEKVDWIIQGGESGPGKRPFDLPWAYAIKRQCEAAGVPYFFKQIDKIRTIPEDLLIRQMPKF